MFSRASKLAIYWNFGLRTPYSERVTQAAVALALLDKWVGVGFI
jgi:hypothetical protein